MDGFEHAVEVTATSLYEAVAMAVGRFRRDDGWVVSPPGPGCEFQVKMLPDSPKSFTVPLKKVEMFVLLGVAKGPKDIVHKNRLRQLMGLDQNGS